MKKTQQRSTEGDPARLGCEVELPEPSVRPLSVYAFDPSLGKHLGNEMTLNVPYEKLLPGPVGQRIAVIDYDGANRLFYKPVDLDDPRLLIRGGLAPSESDPRFHQQMVYAVVSDTIQHFEAALGRSIRWRLDERVPDAKGNTPEGVMPGDIYRLNLYPHAMIGANAAYSPDAKGILFGYFRASESEPGRNLPGQTVFTCLSHDIIVHETTHAILDGIRTGFAERTNPDVPAFHEAFADLAALFRHFSHREALLDTIRKTGGRLYQHSLRPDAEGVLGAARGSEGIQAEESLDNPLVGLAQQFGEARGSGRALRSALGQPPDPSRLRDPDLEPHERGAILVSAVFDAYFTIYLRRTADLFSLVRSGGGGDSLEIPAALANLLADKASDTAERFFRICVRAIDYCPPVDITFGDYLRAVLTADRDLYPTDEMRVRDAFMQAFRLRGIVPEGAPFFSEDALCWPLVRPTAGSQGARVQPEIKGLIFGNPNGLSHAEKDANGDLLRRFAVQNADWLGFQKKTPISVPSFHPTFRVGSDGRLKVDMVVQMLQTREEPFDPQDPSKGTFPVRGGVTLLVSQPPVEARYAKASKSKEPAGAEIRYAIAKGLPSAAGVERQRRFLQREGLLQDGVKPQRFAIDFNMLHGGL